MSLFFFSSSILIIIYQYENDEVRDRDVAERGVVREEGAGGYDYNTYYSSGNIKYDYCYCNYSEKYS